MTSVIKIGGSLMDYPERLKQLCEEIQRLSPEHSMIIIPGGGHFADYIRRLDNRFHFSASTSHKMAILAMDQYGLFLSELLQGVKMVQSLSEAKKSGYAILLPSKLLLEVSEKTLPHSWNVTSDSIACYIATKARAEKLMLVKAVDGIFDEKSKKITREVSAREMLNKTTCVDRMLPELLLKYKMDCCILNGKYPERLRGALEGKQTICTWITYR